VNTVRMRCSYSQCLALLVTVGILLVLAGGQTGWAQVGISTFVLDMHICPGEIGRDSLSLTNNGESAQGFRIEVTDWIPIGPNAQEYLPAGTLARSISEWLDFTPSEGVIQPGEAVEVQVEVAAPSTAEGVYWGMLFIRLLGEHTETGAVEAGTHVGMNVVLGVAVYVNTGGGQPQGRVVGFSCEALDSKKQMEFTVEFENTGITRLRPTGKIEIRDASGDTVREIHLPTFISLPDTKQRVQAPLTTVPSKGPGEENIEAAELQPPLPPGSYVAIAIIDYGGDSLIGAQLPFSIEEGESG